MHDLPVRPGGDQVAAQAATIEGFWYGGRFHPVFRGGDGTDGGTGGNGTGDGGSEGEAPPAGEGGEGPGGQDPQGESDDGGDLDADSAKRLVKGLRQEAAKNRARAKELEAELKKHRDAQKSETERLRDQAAEAQKRAEEAEARLKKAQTVTLVERMAAKKGFRDPSDAVLLVDMDSLETDGSGIVLEASIGTALATIAREKPYLLGGTGGGPTNPASGRSSLTFEDVQKMTPEQINENWDEVQKVLAARR